MKFVLVCQPYHAYDFHFCCYQTSSPCDYWYRSIFKISSSILTWIYIINSTKRVDKPWIRWTFLVIDMVKWSKNNLSPTMLELCCNILRKILQRHSLYLLFVHLCNIKVGKNLDKKIKNVWFTYSGLC